MKTLNILLRLLFISGIILTLSTDSLAQEEKKKTKTYGGGGYFMIGWQGLNFDALNDAFSQAGIPTISSSLTSMGGGGHSIVGRVILGGEGHGIFASESTNGTYTSSIGGGYGYFNLGYLAVQKGGFFLYPMIGLGGCGLTYVIKENRANYDFNEIIEDPAVGFEASTGGFLLSGQLGADYNINFGDDPRERGGLLIGIRAGYNWAPSQSWEYYGSTISNHPGNGFQGFFVKMVIGGGGFASSN